MDTELLSADRAEDVAHAAELLRQGRIVAFPTETVYGLGARADDPDALAELSRVKHRPQEKKFALLIPWPDEMRRYGVPGPAAVALAQTFWPGPLTLVIPDGRGGDVGLRCPACPVTAELLRLVGTAVATPSANVSGQPAATTAAQVVRTFAGRIAAVLDGGPAKIGEPSTVVRVTDGHLSVLRHGAISEARLREALAAGV